MGSDFRTGVGTVQIACSLISAASRSGISSFKLSETYLMIKLLRYENCPRVLCT